jgi:hypothetical protein
MSQTVWLESTATTYTALCEECLAHPADPYDTLAYRAAKVFGSLRAEADVGFTRCRRGHRLSIRRVARGSPQVMASVTFPA